MTDGLQNFSQQSYEIRVLGRIDPQRKDWFGGLDFSSFPSQDGLTVTILTGTLADQAALFGVMNRIRDLGLRLISVSQISPHLTQSQQTNCEKR